MAAEREGDRERMGTNRNIHTVSMNYVIGVCVCKTKYMLYMKLLRPLIAGAAPLIPTMGRRQE